MKKQCITLILDSIIYLLLAITSLTSAIACGPTPQKVVKEIMIKADAATVWQVLKQFEAIAQWHQDVKTSELIQKKDEEGATATYRLIKLKSGVKFEEKRRDTPELEMKLDSTMTQGDLAVSNYRSVMQVKAGPITSENAGQTIVTWTARFNNQANTLDAPAGQDNATALRAINVFYDDGLTSLKNFIENGHQ